MEILNASTPPLPKLVAAQAGLDRGMGVVGGAYTAKTTGLLLG